MWTMEAFDEFLPEGQRQGKARRTEGRGERKVKGGSWWKRVQKGFGKGGQGAGSKEKHHGEKDRGRIRHGERESVDQHDGSFECNMLSAEVCPEDCTCDEDWWCILVKHVKSLNKCGRRAQRCKIREKQFEVWEDHDEQDMDSTTIPSDNESELSGGTWVMGFRRFPAARGLMAQQRGERTGAACQLAV